MTTKHFLRLPLLLLAALTLLCGCHKEPDTIDCTISWQLYHQPKDGAAYLTDNDIEEAFRVTFYGYYERVNDNTVIARSTTQADVRSITLKLASMADARIRDMHLAIDPALDQQTEVRLFIRFGTSPENSYIEEIWSQSYR